MFQQGWLTNPQTDAMRALAADLKKLIQNPNVEDVQQVRTVAEVVTPLIETRVRVEDIWAGILNELDWTDVPVAERKFRVPDEIIGKNVGILLYQNGVTLPSFSARRRFVTAEVEELATPEFVYDVRELRRADALMTIESATNVINKMLLVHKAKKGYELLTHGFDDPGVNVTVIVDDGTYDSNDQLAFLRTLRDTVEETVRDMQSKLGGRPRINLVTEQLTNDRLLRSGLAADWNSRLTNDPTGQSPNSPRFAPILNQALVPYNFPNFTDNLNDEIIDGVDDGDPIITEGDLLLVAPGAANIARVEPLEPSTRQVQHWTYALAFRGGWSYIRWSDKGDINKIRRIMVLRKVGVHGEARGVLRPDGLYSTGLNLYSTRPIDKDTISNTTIIVSTTNNGAAATGNLTPVMKGDLRHFRVNFTTPLTPGNNYYVRSVGAAGTPNTGLLDLAGDYITPLDATLMQAVG